VGRNIKNYLIKSARPESSTTDMPVQKIKLVKVKPGYDCSHNCIRMKKKKSILSQKTPGQEETFMILTLS
jgi:hypothetical protein